ncbi:MAG: DNA repair protein RadA, partial [Bacteroidia bacterium]
HVEDPGIDLAVVCAVLSSNADIPIGSGICFAAEVGLSGEIRPVNRIEQRIGEAEKLGFSEIYISKFHKGIKSGDYAIKIHAVSKIEDVFGGLFG